MTKKKKGDILEWMVHNLEQSLATNKSKIIRQYPLIDEHGVKRALDIYAETEVNGKILKYAFECKHYKYGIKISHITDFHAMIANKGIKGFFVSTSNYQSGAKEKATALGIELLHLKKRDANSNDIKGMIIIGKEFQVTGIQIIGHLNDGQSLDTNSLIENCPACSKTIIDMINKDLIPVIQNHMDEAAENIHPGYSDVRKLATTIGEKNAKEIDIMACFEDSTITHKGVDIHIKKIILKVKVWNQAIEEEPISQYFYSYLGNTSENIIANFSANEFLLKNENLMMGISILNDGKRKLSITNNIAKTTNVSEMICLGNIDELGIKKALTSMGSKHR